jgi:hypothetical protein
LSHFLVETSCDAIGEGGYAMHRFFARGQGGQSRTLRLISMAALIAVAFGAGSIFTALGTPATSTYYGCVQHLSPQLSRLAGVVPWLAKDGTIYGATTSGPVQCQNGDAAISWDQNGPAGATGATGPQGNSGPSGPTGAAGAGSLSHTGRINEDGSVASGLPVVVNATPELFDICYSIFFPQGSFTPGANVMGFYQPIMSTDDVINVGLGTPYTPRTVAAEDSDTPVAADGSVTVNVCFFVDDNTEFEYNVVEEN